MKKLFVLSVVLLLVACSSGDDQAKSQEVEEHIWKSQTDMINKSRNLEGLLQDAADKRQQEADRQAGGQAE